MSNSYLRASEIANKLGVHITTVWRWSRDKKKLAQGFPTPVKISDKVTAFSKPDFDKFVQSRIPKTPKNVEKVKDAQRKEILIM